MSGAKENSSPRLILASGSSARKRLLDGARVSFLSHPADLDEGPIKRDLKAGGAAAGAAALELAAAKARKVSTGRPGAYVIGADQILDLDGAWFDKPADRDGARDHLIRLRGHTHSLADGVVVVRDGEILWQYQDTARLTMRDFSDGFLTEYLDQSGPEILESVGAYRLEDRGAQLFSAIDGGYFTILGLPLLPLLDFLRREGLIIA